MHISEGVLSGSVLAIGGVLAISITIIGLKKVEVDKVANIGILSAAFFVASLIHINLGPSSVHLVLNGIIGLLLGWAAVPAILVGLILQAVFFQYGGFSVLGVNTINMAVPAVIGYYLLRPLVLKSNYLSIFAAFLCGSGAVFLTSFMVAFSLIYTEESFWEVSVLLLTSHIPVMIIEGVVTVFCVGFLKKVRPEIFYVCSPAYSNSQ